MVIHLKNHIGILSHIYLELDLILWYLKMVEHFALVNQVRSGQINYKCDDSKSSDHSHPETDLDPYVDLNSAELSD